MPLSVARCTLARSLSLVVLVALSRDVGAQADPRDALIQEQRQRIENLELKLRVQELERKLEKPPAQTPPAAAPPKAAAAPPPAPPAAPPQRPSASGPTPGESEDAARGDEGGRALERTLVREGGLVLPRGVIEIEPRLQYTYRGSEGLSLAVVNGVAQVAQQDVRRDDVEGSIAARVGLRSSLQLDVRLPYVWINQTRATGGAVTESERVSGWGDVEFGLSKQLSTQRRGGVLGSLVWKTANGRHELGRLSPGSGFPQLQAALNAVMREDPLVFFVSPSYTWVFDREKSGVNVNPGNVVALKAGTILAASPETSLRGSLELSRSARTQIGGTKVPGTDTTVGILELGMGKVLSQRTLLDVQLGIGITPDAPDFRLRFAVPVRFMKGL